MFKSELISLQLWCDKNLQAQTFHRDSCFGCN